MLPLHLFTASLAAPFFLRCLLLAGWLIGAAHADSAVRLRALLATDYPTARDALIEAVEADGLAVGAVLSFGDMLQRTAGNEASPYLHAETVQFCSSVLARRLAREAPQQIALCPLSIAVYVTVAEPNRVFYAWRTLGQESPSREAADALLERLADRAANLARLR